MHYVIIKIAAVAPKAAITAAGPATLQEPSNMANTTHTSNSIRSRMIVCNYITSHIPTNVQSQHSQVCQLTDCFGDQYHIGRTAVLPRCINMQLHQLRHL